jgi:hypothetical protein
MKQDLTIYEIIARNIKVKLAMRVRGKVWTITDNNVITVGITQNADTYTSIIQITDLNDTDSTAVSENIYRDYRKNILKKFFTFD